MCMNEVRPREDGQCLGTPSQVTKVKTSSKVVDEVRVSVPSSACDSGDEGGEELG